MTCARTAFGAGIVVALDLSGPVLVARPRSLALFLLLSPFIGTDSPVLSSLRSWSSLQVFGAGMVRFGEVFSSWRRWRGELNAGRGELDLPFLT